MDFKQCEFIPKSGKLSLSIEIKDTPENLKTLSEA